jgi:hypothetical protein
MKDQNKKKDVPLLEEIFSGKGYFHDTRLQKL